MKRGYISISQYISSLSHSNIPPKKNKQLTPHSMKLTRGCSLENSTAFGFEVLFIQNSTVNIEHVEFFHLGQERLMTPELSGTTSAMAIYLFIESPNITSAQGNLPLKLILIIYLTSSCLVTQYSIMFPFIVGEFAAYTNPPVSGDSRPCRWPDIPCIGTCRGM